MFRKPKLPPLVLFLIKWTAIGVASGLLALVGVLALNVGGLATLLRHSTSPWIVVYIMANSFALSGATFVVGVAIWVRHDFGGDGNAPISNPRLERWKAGESGIVRPEDQDRPLP